MAKNAKRNPADAFFAGLTESFTKAPEREVPSVSEEPKITEAPKTSEAPKEPAHIEETHVQQTKSDAELLFSRDDREVKSKRVNLILQPSLYAKAQKVAKKHGISFNEMITQMLRHITDGQ